MLCIGLLHWDGDGGNPIESAGYPLEWKLPCRKSREDGDNYHGSSTGIKDIFAGFPGV